MKPRKSKAYRRFEMIDNCITAALIVLFITGVSVLLVVVAEHFGLI